MQTAIITGAAKRLGRLIALHLANKGFNLILHYNQSAQDILSLKEEVQAIGVIAKLLKIDFSDKEELNNIDLGEQPINLLINNAAIFEKDEIYNASVESIERHFRINCIAPILMCQKLASHLKIYPATDVSVINILDFSILMHPESFFSYHISKQSMMNFSQIAARELAPIRINDLMPGYVIKNDRESQEHFDEFAKTNPLKKPVTPQDIMNAIDYFTDNKNLTGNFIRIDSGASSGYNQNK